MTGQLTTRAGRDLLTCLTTRGTSDNCPYETVILAIEAEAREECEERNRNLQATLDLLTRDDTIVCDPEHHAQELADARAAALAEREALREAGRLSRNVLIHGTDDEQHFEGEWVAIPREDFDRWRAALAETPKESR